MNESMSSQDLYSSPLRARGIIHCHSDLSYDCKVSLPELSRQLRSEGFHFVALTEHALGVTRKAYEDFVARCRDETSDEFVVLPGIEFRCEDGVEIAGAGLWEFMEGNDAGSVVSQIHAQGGYAIWVHPKKRGYKIDRLLECDAVEVLNAKVDGTVAPDFELLNRVLEARQTEGRSSPQVIFGLDLHNLDQLRDVWIECAVRKLDAQEILASLGEGRFWSCVPQGRVSANGEMPRITRLRLELLRWAYLKWNSGRSRVPASFRPAIQSLSRPFIKSIKRK